MIEKRVIIKLPIGLHARPASKFAKIASAFNGDVYLLKDSSMANAKSILSILSLALEEGSEVILRVEGENEEEVFKRLVAILTGEDENEN